jgi:hypothetical protein
MQFDSIGSWQRKVMEDCSGVVNTFADTYKGRLSPSSEGISVRVPSSQGIITITVSLRKPPRKEGEGWLLEVTGIKRSGLETKRTVFPLSQGQTVDAGLFRKSLDLALNG